MREKATLLYQEGIACSHTTSSVPLTRLTHVSKLLNARRPVTPAALRYYSSRRGVMTSLRTVPEPDAALSKLSSRERTILSLHETYVVVPVPGGLTH